MWCRASEEVQAWSYAEVLKQIIGPWAEKTLSWMVVLNNSGIVNHMHSVILFRVSDYSCPCYQRDSRSYQSYQWGACKVPGTFTDCSVMCLGMWAAEMLPEDVHLKPVIWRRNITVVFDNYGRRPCWKGQPFFGSHSGL
jgi:hypothetical protein